MGCSTFAEYAVIAEISAAKVIGSYPSRPILYTLRGNILRITTSPTFKKYGGSTFFPMKGEGTVISKKNIYPCFGLKFLGKMSYFEAFFRHSTHKDKNVKTIYIYIYNIYICIYIGGLMGYIYIPNSCKLQLMDSLSVF